MRLPAPNYRETVNVADATNADIISVLESNFEKAVVQTKDYAKKFASPAAGTAALKVWDFLKQNIKYKRDDDQKQAIRLPNRFVNDRAGDCKSYALFAASVLHNLGYRVAFRYTSYSPGNKKPSHVYVYMPDQGIIVDGVYNFFNSEKPYVYKYDHVMDQNTINMEVVTLSDDVSVNGSLIRAYNASKKGSLKHRLLYNEIARKQGRRYKPVNAEYLQAQMKLIKSPGSPEYLLAMKELDAQGVQEVDSLNGIGKIRVKRFLKKVGKAVGKGAKAVAKGAKNYVKEAVKVVKKFGLAPGRNAFLGLVRLNVRNLAKTLDYNLQTKRGALLKRWGQLGGKSSALINAINAGKEKKSVGGIDGIGTLEVILSTAAPILIGLAVFLKSVKKGDPSTATDILQAAGAAGVDFNAASQLLNEGEAAYENGYTDEPGDGGADDDNGAGLPPADGGGDEASFSPSPILVFGLGLAAVAMLSKK